MKTILLAVFIVVSAMTLQAQDVLHLSINNKSIGEAPVNSETPMVLQVSKAKYRNIKSLILEYRQTQPVAAYKKSIEITDDKESVLYTGEELSSKPGKFAIVSASSLKKLAKQNILKVYILLNPRNDRMGMPSRRNLVAELHMK